MEDKVAEMLDQRLGAAALGLRLGRTRTFAIKKIKEKPVSLHDAYLGRQGSCNMLFKIAVFFVVLWAMPLTAALSKTYSFKCKFPSYETTFAGEAGSGKATVVGNLGTAIVMVHIGPNAIRFMEPVTSGVVQTTTIKLNDMGAVESRNSILFGQFVQSQVVGKCLRLHRQPGAEIP